MRTRGFLSLVVSMLFSLVAQSAEIAPTPPTYSPLQKYKSQEELLHSRAAVKNALGNFFAWRPLVSERAVLRAMAKDDRLVRSLERAHELRYVAPTDANQNGIFNSGGSLDGTLRLDYGACAGVSTFSWMLGTLAAFDPEGEREYRGTKDFAKLDAIKEMAGRTTALTAEESKEFLAFYRPYIDRLTIDTAFTVVPFFSGAMAWTAHPALVTAFKWRVMELWFSKVSTFGGVLDMLLATEPHLYSSLKHAEVRRVARDVEKYLYRKIHPLVFVAGTGKGAHAKWIHVLQAWKVTQSSEKGEIIIHVIDPNYSGKRRHGEIIIQNVSPSFRFDGRQKVSAYYSDWGKYRPLTEVEIVPWMSDLAVKAGLSLLRAAEEDPMGLDLFTR